MRAFLALVRADFLDRARRTGFLYTLTPAAYLGYTVYAGYWTMRHGDFRAAAGAAYLGAMTALLAGLVLSLFGFYLVKNSISRDRVSRVGEILAATPLRIPAYTLGKAGSNLLVLTSMVAVLAGAAWVVAVTGPGRAGADLLVPFLLLAMPLMALTAAAAVFFEATRGLRGGFGNVVWLLIWAGLPMAAIQGDAVWLDPTGLAVVRSSLLEAQREAYPLEPAPAISLSAGPRTGEYRTFDWRGIEWTVESVASRLWWLALAVLLALAAALPFDRFDPAREPRRRRAREAATAAARSSPAAHGRAAEGHLGGYPNDAVERLLEPAAGRRLPRFPSRRQLAGELRLLLAGQPAFWYLGALALLVAQLLVPLDVVARHLLPFVWIWPLVAWSRLGCQSRLVGAESLLDAAPRPVLRQLPGSWAAGVAVGLLMAAPAVLRLLLAGGWAWIGLVAAATFVPALALALGSLSGTPRLFEVVYLLLWYAGPLSGLAAVDFLGASSPEGGPGAAPLFAASAVPLLLIAVWARRRRLRR